LTFLEMISVITHQIRGRAEVVQSFARRPVCSAASSASSASPPQAAVREKDREKPHIFLGETESPTHNVSIERSCFFVLILSKPCSCASLEVEHSAPHTCISEV
jgi:hypothetical protein